MRTAGVVLAGGRSRRMGTDKAGLDWHGAPLLVRTAGMVARCVDGPIVVVRTPGQALPALAGAEVVDDPVAGRGPLQGVAVGLGALAGRAEAAFVSAVDLPLLHPRLVRLLLAALDAAGAEAAVPVVAGRRQPLAAVYRVELAARAAALLAEGAGPTRLLAMSAVCEVDEARLRSDPVLSAVDPDLRTLVDVDDPATYRALRELPPPTVTVRSDATGPQEVRAAVVGAALAAAGFPRARSVRLRAAGAGPLDAIPAIAGTPLAEGDAIEVTDRAAAGPPTTA